MRYLKNIKKMISIALISIMLLIVGCSNNTNSSTVTKESSATKWYQDLSAQEFKSVIEDPEVFVLDVHTPEQPHIKGTDAVIPFDKLEVNLAKLPKDKNTKIALYCRSGSMSKEASEELITLGYTNINNLEGGANAWKNEGFPVEELVK